MPYEERWIELPPGARLGDDDVKSVFVGSFDEAQPHGVCLVTWDRVTIFVPCDSSEAADALKVRLSKQFGAIKK